MNIFKRKQGRARIESNFSVVNVYLWLHGIGFTRKFRLCWKNIFISIVSILFAVICNACALHEILERYQTEGRFSRRAIIYLMKYIAEIFQRIFIYFKRIKLWSIVKRISALQVSLNPANTLNFKLKLAICLFVHDIILVGTILMNCWFIIRTNRMIHGCKTKITDLIKLFIVHWSFALPPLAASFCTICFLLTHTLKELKTKLIQDLNTNFETFFCMYSEATIIISEINDTFHNMIVAGLVSFLVNSFLNILQALTSRARLTALNVLFVNIYLIHNMCNIIGISISSTSVSKALSKIKDVVYEHPFRSPSNSILRIFFKVKEKFEGFTLFGSIVIDKRFILTIFSLLITYSVMFATFTVNY